MWLLWDPVIEWCHLHNFAHLLVCRDWLHPLIDLLKHKMSQLMILMSKNCMYRRKILSMLLFFPVFQLSHGIEFNVTKDGKLCLYANLELTFSVTYEDLDNQVGVFVLAMWITILKSTAVHINTVLTCDSSLALIRHFSCDSVFVPVMWRGNEGFPEKTHFLLFSI